MRRIVVALTAAVLVLVAAAPAAADDPPRLVLTLDPGATGVTAADVAPEHPACDQIPGGAVVGLDGWTFDQPVAGGTGVVYIIGYLADVDTDPTPVLIGVDASGTVRIPFPLTAAVSAATVGARARAQAAAPRLDPPDGSLPAGVTGSLVDGGAGGVRLTTPAGWVLLAGALRVDTDATGPTVFSLTGACAAVPAPTPTRTAPATGTSTGAPPTAGGPALPTTGTPTGPLAVLGLAVLCVGAVLVGITRRRRADARG